MKLTGASNTSQFALYFLFNSVQPATYDGMALCTDWDQCPFPVRWCCDWCNSQHQYLQMEE